MDIRGGKVSLRGDINAPGDKSISHRAIMMGSISKGKTEIYNFLMSEDCLHTIQCFKDMGVKIDVTDDKITVYGKGLKGLVAPKDVLYVGNSGTTIRIMSGILAGQEFETEISGDRSILDRPMDRIIKPLSLMGADIKGKYNKYPPLIIKPSNNIKGIEYYQTIASAQVKSSILFLSLFAEGITKVIQPSKSRDHTEKMMKYFGVDIKEKDREVIVNPQEKPVGKEIYVPGDISSVAFFIVGALILKGSSLTVRNVGYNKTRAGIIEVLKKMGGNLEVFNLRKVNNEPIVDIKVKYSHLKGIEIKGDIIPRLIDEIPIIAVAASCAEGRTIICDAEELKYKESNRIEAIVNELFKMGIDISKTDDGMVINGVDNINKAELLSYSDHRIAMSLIIASLKSNGLCKIDDISSIKTSYPEFFKVLNKILIRKR